MNDRKKVLVIHYSQTGQLDKVVQSVVSPLQRNEGFDVSFLELQPTTRYPFPWPFVRFINAFPEAVHDKGCELEAIAEEVFKDYDLIMLGYQVWFLSPSNPVTAFLQSDSAQRLLKGKPVITVIACRNMWLLAQERVKSHLSRIGAKLVGNISLTDECGAFYSFLSTPLWVLTGHKGPFWFGIPRAGVAEQDILDARRFGLAIQSYFNENKAFDTQLFRGLGAVKINVNLIASEKIATRSFKIWGKLFLLFGNHNSIIRKGLVFIYALFLLCMILTVAPLNALIKKLASPLMKAKNQALREYYAAPSGEATDKL